ncbi:hypothetical protein [Cyanobium gracile]|uniref:Uncharacterized protein n=1 Tax=Cyanobium gracile UHCC 0281 TaxID=3110309 RepID=A0ABU5SUI7_9CYAN|nr:hypothetical protein [Cyanobium gracile]MEA5442136.1 hypothetical protein [Cyanobium gracile UHCC 0281]
MEAAVGKHLFAALLAEGIKALAAVLQQPVALVIAQLVAADQAVVAIALGGDAVAGEHPAHHALPRIRRATSCAGAGAWGHHGGCDRGWHLPFEVPSPFAMPTLHEGSVSGSTPATQDGDPL